MTIQTFTTLYEVIRKSFHAHTAVQKVCVTSHDVENFRSEEKKYTIFPLLVYKEVGVKKIGFKKQKEIINNHTAINVNNHFDEPSFQYCTKIANFFR